MWLLQHRLVHFLFIILLYLELVNTLDGKTAYWFDGSIRINKCTSTFIFVTSNITGYQNIWCLHDLKSLWKPTYFIYPRPYPYVYGEGPIGTAPCIFVKKAGQVKREYFWFDPYLVFINEHAYLGGHVSSTQMIYTYLIISWLIYSVHWLWWYSKFNRDCEINYINLKPF